MNKNTLAIVNNEDLTNLEKDAGRAIPGTLLDKDAIVLNRSSFLKDLARVEVLPNAQGSSQNERDFFSDGVALGKLAAIRLLEKHQVKEDKWTK